jgi:FAD/FMN-containing dehydrogenase
MAIFLTPGSRTPLAVVLPQSVEQIKQVLKICKTHNTPVVTRGAGTGLSGGAMPLEESVVLGLSLHDFHFIFRYYFRGKCLPM